MIDFKIKNFIEDGENTSAEIAFFKGEITTKDERQGNDPETGALVTAPVTRYRRTESLGSRVVKLGKTFEKKSHTVLVGRLKQELKKLALERGEEEIPEQK
jgi:hypothetical protein